MNRLFRNDFDGVIELGDHLVILYRDDSDITETVANFIITSLNSNLKMIYIMGDADTESIISYLTTVDYYHEYVRKGQLVFIQKEDAYSKDGKFDPHKMKDLLIELSKSSLEEGYEGLAISGEISWVLEYDKGFDLINEYEWLINSEVFHKYPVTALCRYNMDRFSDEMIINVIQVHPYLIIDNKVHENPFFIPAVAYEEHDIPRYQVETMLKNIVSYTNIKSDFYIRLKEQEEENARLNNEMVNDIIYSMVGLLELHSEFTINHSSNVAHNARMLSKRLGLSKNAQIVTFYTALIHDIGKIKVPKEILDKPKKLTKEEYKVVQKHPEWGAQALMSSEKLNNIAKFVHSHHEHYDGSGYPRGLKGSEIPLISRIISVCDAYDAMTSDRPYRAALSKTKARDELLDNKGTQFDPEVVDVFIESLL